MELKQILSKAAPWLAAAAAGPAGIAAMAAKTVAEALGAGTTDPGELAAAVAGATPEQIQALKLADLNFKLRMSELGFANIEAMERINVDDRKDARSRDVELHKSGYRNVRADVMVAVAFLAVIGIAFILAYFANLKGEVIGFLTAVGGMFARNIGTAFDFEFGSSRSSRDKDAMIAQVNGK